LDPLYTMVRALKSDPDAIQWKFKNHLCVGSHPDAIQWKFKNRLCVGLCCEM